MRKNYSNGARTVIEGYSSDEYVALKDAQIDTANKLFVKGIFSHKSKYGESYALVVEEEKDLHTFNINIPAWLGKNLKKDLVEFKIQDVKYSKNMVLLKLEGIDDIGEAEKFKNFYIKINRKDAVELEEDSYFIVDIIGCKVFTDENEFLGKVIDVFQTGSNDVYTVKNNEDKEILLPAIEDVIKDIDIANKKIVVKLMDGLIWK